MDRRRVTKAAGVLLVLGVLAHSVAAMPPGPEIETLIETSETVLGQEIVYPEGRVRITAQRITVPPGAVLAPHLHPVPLFGYVLQGELIVDYGTEGEIVYQKGDALAEAIDWPHQGRNGGRGRLVILVVYAGAEGVLNTEPATLR